MMDFSFLSTHDSSVCNADKSIYQIQEIDSIYNDYNSVVEYQSSTKVSELCSKFKDITKRCSDDNDYLMMIKSYLGNLSHYVDCLEKKMSLMAKNSEGELYQSYIFINNEINTWKLIHGLYEDRFKNANLDGGLSIARSSELELVRDLYKQNTNFREAQIAVDWLEMHAKEKTDKNENFLLGAYGKSWEHTKHAIQKRNMMKNDLDPDAPLRGCLILTDNDKNDENEYLRYLYYCIQSGDWDKAQSLCQKHEELWRALSLEGWRPLHNASMEFNSDIIGNPNRSIFKSVCWELSEDTHLNIYERAIYAIFCGNINVLSLVEKDWDGLLWAHFKVYIEHVVDDYLLTFTMNGPFGTQSLFGDSDFDLGIIDIKSNYENNTLNTHSSIVQIFDGIASKLIHSPIDIINKESKLGTKLNLLFYKSVFEMIQQFIIMNDVEGLIYHIQLTISKLSTKKTTLEKLMIRFLTHVVIFIYSIHVDLKMDAYHNILTNYIECLIEDRSLENISFYVSKLSTDLQIKWYCVCMKGVTDYIEKKRCIFDGLNYDLPIVEISRIVVRNIRMNIDTFEISKSFPKSFSKVGDEPLNIEYVTDFDNTIIDSLDWLTFLPEQYCHLIRESNALCRIFLINDKLEAVKIILNKISKDIVNHLQNNISMYCDIAWLPTALYENQCYKAFIAFFDAFGDWDNYFSKLKPIEKDFNIQQDLNRLSFQEKQSLQKQYEDYNLSLKQWENVTEFHANKVLNMFSIVLRMGDHGWLSDIGFTNEWMYYDEFNKNDNDSWLQRKEDIFQLRKKNVVNLCSLLTKVFINSGKDERCFELVNLLADEKLGLWQCFENTQLQQLLQQVRQCSLRLLSDGQDVLGVEV